MVVPKTFDEATRSTLFTQSCERQHCDSSQPGEFFPVLLFTTGYEMRIGEAVCADCRSSLTFADYLSDTLWASVVESLGVTNQQIPARAQTKLNFVPLSASVVKSNPATTGKASRDFQGSSGGFG